ncbi:MULTISPECIES: biotin transporter BioY [Parageobacillus]|jgi:biotin transport system substrate-specific component|uniref:Biotin transporter n=1 Tax=Parageobacillus thermoglucosidasius TaxID=1426 RepID=A0A1B7KQK0_PARTM|nr:MULTISPECIES: biotin transporter BioY [Parageobacillus]OAT72290.1 biotin biosynthesis protein BioY [Parageobacillus thermoglucosidasius]BDG45901.1 biotin transporter BioY [Parageobacillus sp. KH3-4]
MKTKSLLLAALFAALTAIGGFIKIPVPYVPFTLQIAAVYLAGCLLGPKLGMLSQLVYVLVGLAGAPVFAEGGGPSYVLQPTFGYLIGFVAGAYVNGWLMQIFQFRKAATVFLANLSTLFVVYLFGCAWLYIAMKWIVEKPLTVGQTLWFGFLLPVPGDLLLCAACSVLVARMLPRIHSVIRKQEVVS